MKSNIIEAALHEYGVKETPSGSTSNPQVLKYFEVAGYAWVKDDSLNAWCSAFANFIAYQCGYKMTESLLARSWLNAGEKVENPEMGDYVIFWRDDIGGPYGHVGIFIKESEDGDSIEVLGGNQADQVSIAKYSKSHVLGYRDITKPWSPFTFESNLKRGAFGPDVGEMQKILGINVDQSFGPKTEEAVKTFQQLHNLNPDGIVGPLTREALNKLL